MSGRARTAAELVGFVVYSGGLVAFVEASPGWPRLAAGLVWVSGLMLAGWARWGRARPVR